MSRFLERWAEEIQATSIDERLTAPSRSVSPPVTTRERSERSQAEIGSACSILNRAGVRIMRLEGAATIGVWSDLDGPEIRGALRVLDSDQLTVRYLDGAGIPMRYKLRRVEGEPVPVSAFAEMDRNPAEPWKVRGGMLNEMGWCLRGVART